LAKSGFTLDAEATCTVNSFYVACPSRPYFDTTCHQLTGGGGLSVLVVTSASNPAGRTPSLTGGSETYLRNPRRNAGPNTNGSQFFMVYMRIWLPPLYTVFGAFDEAGLKLTPRWGADGSPAETVPPRALGDIRSVTVS
jgi:peptidyl-prolyl cis-trans isomerase B (cyclophilin B)